MLRTCCQRLFYPPIPLPPPLITITRAFLSSSPLNAQLKEGDTLRKERGFTHQEVVKYSQLSQDSNPIHLDSAQAREAGFKDTVVHGMLYAGLFPSIIASHFPGAIYVSQTLQFKAPVCIEDKLLAEVQALELREHRKKYRVRFATKCFIKEGMLLVLDGEAVALLPNLDYAG
ncbi:3-hydroxyacyl-[acyl-carrier-protein] dehydratase, mitochondrial [Cryptomeria japonica]|uniref:3-hydroxyacyl-[acyl-carrier-protein] dehydratase, mitochondrial n=1 Tax=Cryptomeria japonica TaxID=3369 RepID=UPI0025AC2BFE|nr:3-hydroxyacyl-[acyl-carrier-protein] dehydratase, mitochondrial [Cryptomeria japonica]